MQTQPIPQRGICYLRLLAWSLLSLTAFAADTIPASALRAIEPFPDGESGWAVVDQTILMRSRSGWRAITPPLSGELVLNAHFTGPEADGWVLTLLAESTSQSPSFGLWATADGGKQWKRTQW